MTVKNIVVLAAVVGATPEVVFTRSSVAEDQRN